jgi:ankyrin repeat protein
MRRRLLEVGSTVLVLLIIAAAVGAFLYYRSLNHSLSLALDRQEMGRVKALIRAGASPTTRSPRGNTALTWAAAWPDEAFAQELLDRGVPVDGRNDNGVTPLMTAAGWAHAGMVRLLLGRGADPNLKDEGNRSAIAFARELLPGTPARAPRNDARAVAARKRVEAVIRDLQRAGGT